MYRFREWIDRLDDIPERFQVDSKKVESVLANARREGSIYILEDKGYEILSAYGFRTVKRILATSEDECIKVAKEIGYPIVIEITTIMRIKKVNFLLEKSINIISSFDISKTIS